MMSYNLQEMLTADGDQKLKHSKSVDALSKAKALDKIFSASDHIPLDVERKAADKLLKARAIRAKYAFKRIREAWDPSGPLQVDDSVNYSYRINEWGIFEVIKEGDEANSLFPVPTLEEYVKDHNECESIVREKTVLSLASHRLKSMEQLYDMHVHQNWKSEETDNGIDNADFFSIAKVDTHIHLSAAFSPKDLLLYMQKAAREQPDEVVLKGKSLKELFEANGLTAETLSIDKLHVQGDADVFDRFDLFNAKYKIAGSSDLKEAFLSYANDANGKHLANITKIAHNRLIEADHTFAEWRISVMGKSTQEWYKIADFMIENNLHDLSCNKWMVQNPRLYSIMKGPLKAVENYGQLIENFFKPLFDATINPTSDENKNLALFLKNLSGFDSVDDESVSDLPLETINPIQWDKSVNPGYAYQLYHFWANIFILNRLRESKGMNTFDFRPHCGESGDLMHLVTGYMLSNGIAHGIALSKSQSLQYLYYLDQIGLHVSPSSNNFLFMKLADSPFHQLFKRGLNVSISTDDPMIFHMSNHPLLEEYSICRIFWSLSNSDMSEIAQNSVLQSGFDHEWKKKWLGDSYHLLYKRDASGNIPDRSNVPNIRAMYRQLVYNHEVNFISSQNENPEPLGI